MDELTFTVRSETAPKIMRECWDVFTIFIAETVYNEVTYKAWGTDVEEAKKKAADLIKLDKVNGIKRNAGDVVE